MDTAVFGGLPALSVKNSAPVQRCTSVFWGLGAQTVSTAGWWGDSHWCQPTHEYRSLSSHLALVASIAQIHFYFLPPWGDQCCAGGS